MEARRLRWAQALLLTVLLIPLAVMMVQAFAGGLGANPVQEILHRLGMWTLRLLLLTLAVTPLRRLTGWNTLIRFRRLIGLTAFAYGVLHLLAYVGLDQFFDWSILLEDVTERPFIIVGSFALLLMVPLAITSTRGWVRRLGRNWTRLHRLVYLSAAAGTLHFWWGVKKDLREPAVYAGILLVLLAVRLVRRAGQTASSVQG
jgi:sulfoxide reductase heme-binding subunit YedZ